MQSYAHYAALATIPWIERLTSAKAYEGLPTGSTRCGAVDIVS